LGKLVDVKIEWGVDWRKSFFIKKMQKTEAYSTESL
jgi:hypothetical protein